jgi:two-component system OmpR family response regulator
MKTRRILIADDNEDAAESLQLLLQLEGHTVLVVNDGNAALEAFDAFKPDVALLDIGMPGLTGYEVAAAIRARSQTAMLVALTGWGQDKDREHARSAGFDYHFTKPVEPEELVALLAK